MGSGTPTTHDEFVVDPDGRPLLRRGQLGRVNRTPARTERPPRNDSIRRPSRANRRGEPDGRRQQDCLVSHGRHYIKMPARCSPAILPDEDQRSALRHRRPRRIAVRAHVDAATVRRRHEQRIAVGAGRACATDGQTFCCTFLTSPPSHNHSARFSSHSTVSMQCQ